MTHVAVFDQLLSPDEADAMLQLCEAFGGYGQYTAETSVEQFAPGLAQRHDAALNFIGSGGRFGDGGSVAELAARTNYFREEYAYGDEVMVAGIEPLLHHDGFLEAARQLHGRAVVVPAIVYANLLIRGQELAVHTDVPEFRGANRRLLPQWLMVVMRHSELFEDWRMRIATGIAYFGRSDGGALAYYPDGPDGGVQTVTTAHNTAVLLDTDSVFHGVDRIGGRQAEAPEMKPGMTLAYDGDGAWELRDGEEAKAVLEWSDIRLSVSWKAYCFTDKAEQDAWRGHTNDLTLDVIFDRLEADLVERGRLPRGRPTIEEDFGRLLIDEYIRFPAGATSGD
jgi:hypothetical protein